MKFKSPEWNAWYNMMPPGPSTLHITSLIDVEEEGVDIQLKFNSLLKKSPPILVLQLQTRTIFIPRESGDTIIRVQYSQIAAPGAFESIIVINNDGKKIKEIDATEISIVW